MTDKKIGPVIIIKLECYLCKFNESERYLLKHSNGINVYCTALTPRKRIADRSWTTPRWCPLVSEAWSSAAPFKPHGSPTGDQVKTAQAKDLVFTARWNLEDHSERFEPAADGVLYLRYGGLRYGGVSEHDLTLLKGWRLETRTGIPLPWDVLSHKTEPCATKPSDLPYDCDNSICLCGGGLEECECTPNFSGEQKSVCRHCGTELTATNSDTSDPLPPGSSEPTEKKEVPKPSYLCGGDVCSCSGESSECQCEPLYDNEFDQFKCINCNEPLTDEWDAKKETSDDETP